MEKTLTEKAKEGCALCGFNGKTRSLVLNPWDYKNWICDRVFDCRKRQARNAKKKGA